MRLLLLVTHQTKSRSEAKLIRLLDSLVRQKLKAPHLVEAIWLLQECPSIPQTLLRKFESEQIRFELKPKIFSASAARNHLIRISEIYDDDCIMFPDDGCWFPDHSNHFLMDTVSTTGCDLLFTRINDPPLDPACYSSNKFFHPSNIHITRRSAMITMIFQGSIVIQIANFDERIRIGISMGGGEDTDYADRASKIAQKT